MLDDPIKYGLLAALAIALVVAAVTDLRSRRIGNLLTGGIALAAPLYWWASGIPLWAGSLLDPSVVTQFGVALATFAILALVFALGGMGGGDVKLLAALALWIAPLPFIRLLMLMALIGGVLTLAFGAWHVLRRRRDKLAIPYGVAISLAGLVVLATSYWPSAAIAAGALR